MGLRFRKTIKLAPGIRMNFSTKGAGWTIGPRGSSIGIGQRAVHLNTSIAGFSSRQQLSGGTSRVAQQINGPKDSTTISISVSVSDDGQITFRDDSGNLLPEGVINIAKKQQGEMIRGLIQKKCDEINAQVEALGQIHFYTPACTQIPTYRAVAFNVPAPTKPLPKRPSFFAKWFKSVVARIEAQNVRAHEMYDEATSAWEADKSSFELDESIRKDLVARTLTGDESAMEIFLESTLNDIVWPRETDLSFEITNDGTKIWVDVDLPEIEDMPDKTASSPQRGYRLSVKDMSATQVQKNYMRHVHAVGFRIIGEVFAALPTINQITLSAYSQRPSKTTGRVSDEYLYSVKVGRYQWSIIDFVNLKNLDVVDSLAQFELRRDMSKTGIFRGIQPLINEHAIETK
jgi:hypothetical protein